MSYAISKQELNRLRKDFREWLSKQNPNLGKSTLSTYVSDAFYALGNDTGIDFWAIFTSDEAFEAAREQLIAHGRSIGWPNPERNAGNYMLAMRRLGRYLEETNPGLAREWGGNAGGRQNLSEAFTRWITQQKSEETGKPYSPRAINAYLSALKSTTGKLHLEDDIRTDLFTYTTLADFEQAYRIITAAPNFRQVNRTTGRNNYSCSMALYKKFLAEYRPPSCWIFQGNPKLYDVVGAVRDCDTMTWAVNQAPKQIKQGDKVYIWVSGENAGILASGSILCDPKLLQPRKDDPYSRGGPLKSEPYLAVDIHIERRFDSRVTRHMLSADARTSRLGVITYPGATNYSVTKAQEAVIESILGGSYIPVPVQEEQADGPSDKKRYWLFAPGEGARLWDEFLREGILAIGWTHLGDLSQYETKNDIKIAVNDSWNDGRNHWNDALAVWNFYNEMQPGDVVFAKRGISKIIGRGVITGGYEFRGERAGYRHVRQIDWTHREEKDYPERLSSYISTIGDITPLTEVWESLENAFEIAVPPPPASFDPYSPEDFLKDVYVDQSAYHTLVGLLQRKKNLILQGAPGVGKTYAAVRLAYAIMGEKDTSRVKTVQFHQSYSYEDFVMGYRPSKEGFTLEKGPFYRFCKEAGKDSDRPYFFIIDEINRGNLSKIFGELLMLIEQDKRSEDHATRLLYAEEQFYVPANVHIIGMMNTADRSLAMIDYALRRRFAFFEMAPAFASTGFRARQDALGNSKFNRLVETVVSLNRAIAEDPSLGSGFCIGHSYFCDCDAVTNQWLTELVEFELLPLLTEYWIDDPAQKEHWFQMLRGAVRG